ncbi:MAG: hypothetical protein ABGZ17_22930, partial [Planctomycetaceae bacterium]
MTEQPATVGTAASHAIDDQADDVAARQFPRLHDADIDDSETASAQAVAQSSNITSATQDSKPAEHLNLAGKTSSANGGTDTPGRLESRGTDQVMLSALESENDTISKPASVETVSTPR